MSIVCGRGPKPPTDADLEQVAAFAAWLRTRPARTGRRRFEEPDPNPDRPDPGEDQAEHDDPWQPVFDPGIDGDGEPRGSRR